jgi:hypothetical protein
MRFSDFNATDFRSSSFSAFIFCKLFKKKLPKLMEVVYLVKIFEDSAAKTFY